MASRKRNPLALYGGPKTIHDRRALRSSWPRQGMEAALREYTGARYVRCVSSGTAALISSLMAATPATGSPM